MWCWYCGKNLGTWNLDRSRILMCSSCVQRLLGYMVLGTPKLASKRRTRSKEGIGMGKSWNYRKLPIKWEDEL